MNKANKRGLEGVLSVQMLEARKAYLARRKAELTRLVDEVRKSPNKKAVAVLAQYDALTSSHEKELREHKEKEQKIRERQRADGSALAEELAQMGYDWHTDFDTNKKNISVLGHSAYDGDVHIYTYTEPRLKPHCDETEAKLKGLYELFNSTVIDLYVGDPVGAVANFRTKVAELTA